MFQNTETLPVLLMNWLQSQEHEVLSVKHNIFTHFTERPTLRYLLEPQILGLLAEDVLVQSCPERNISVI